MNPPPLQFKIQPFKEVWPSVKKQWLDLFLSCNDPCVFYHPGFLDAAEIQGDSIEPGHLVLGYSGTALVFGLPVNFIKRAGSSELAFFSGPGFDHLAPLDASDGWEHSRQFFTDSKSEPGFNTLKIDNTSETFFNSLARSLPGKSFSRIMFRCPYFTLPDSPAEILTPFNSKFRSNLKRRMRLLDELGVSYRLVDNKSGADALAESFQRLVDLHHERAEKKEIHSQFAREVPLAFYASLCRCSTAYPGMLKFMEVLLEGRVIGSLMGFCSPSAFHFHQHGFTLEHAKYAVGSVLIYKMMEESINNNIKKFDFLRGADEYKFFWTKDFTTDYFFAAQTASGGLPAVYQHKLRFYRRRYGKLKGTLLGIFGSSEVR